jgi:hypothetical protein
MTFQKYPKVHRLGKEEVEGILEGVVHVEEKIDGANASIWLDKRGEITCGSRNRELSEGFNGFVDWVQNSELLKIFFSENPELRLYGEWLVPHTIQYNEMAYKTFYLFDVTIVKDGEEIEDFADRKVVQMLANNYGFTTPHYYGSFINPSPDELLKLAGTSTIGAKGEGIVLKNQDFRDKFGNHNYAKIVTESFKEDNGITFGGNNKHSDSYWEMYIVNKYMTLPRIEKICNKLQSVIEEKLDMKHIPRVIQTAYHDMLTEEIWEIQDKVTGPIHFGVLKRIATRKARQIYSDKLQGFTSVADRVN